MLFELMLSRHVSVNGHHEDLFFHQGVQLQSNVSPLLLNTYSPLSGKI